MRKKIKMENQRKKLESRKFFEKKIRKQGTFKRKKNLQWKNFAKKFCDKKKKIQTWGAPPRLPRRRWARRRRATMPAARLPAAAGPPRSASRLRQPGFLASGERATPPTTTPSHCGPATAPPLRPEAASPPFRPDSASA